MKTTEREVEPWRVPVLELRALARQLSAQPQFITALAAAEKVITSLTPDVSVMEVSPLGGLAGATEKARPGAATDSAAVQRKRDKTPATTPSAASGPSTPFANVSNVIAEALHRGAAVVGNASQTGSGIGRAISGEAGGGADGKALGLIGKALAEGAAFPVDPARRGRDASVVPIDRKQGGVTGMDSDTKKSPFANAALAAMEALSKATKDQAVTPGAPPKAQKESALDTGLNAVQRVGEIAGKLIEAGTEQLTRPRGGFMDALTRLPSVTGGGADKASAPSSTLGKVDRLATDLIARGVVAGALRGAGEAMTAGESASPGAGASPEAVQAGATAVVTPPAHAPATTAAPAHPPAAPATSAAAALPDAASITALVNEVLMEQARRHGVDLT